MIGFCFRFRRVVCGVFSNAMRNMLYLQRNMDKYSKFKQKKKTNKMEAPTEINFPPKKINNKNIDAMFSLPVAVCLRSSL